MTEEALAMGNVNNQSELNSTPLTISLPSELSFLNKVPSKMLNKNAMTDNRKSIADKPPPIPTAYTYNNMGFKDETTFGSCWRNTSNQQTNQLMNSSYVVSSHISLPSSVSNDVSQTSPTTTNSKNHKNHSLSSFQNIKVEDQKLFYFQKQKYESLHSYKHFDEDISNNRQMLNKPGQIKTILKSALEKKIRKQAPKILVLTL